MFTKLRKRIANRREKARKKSEWTKHMLYHLGEARRYAKMLKELK